MEGMEMLPTIALRAPTRNNSLNNEEEHVGIIDSHYLSSYGFSSASMGSYSAEGETEEEEGEDSIGSSIEGDREDEEQSVGLQRK